MRKTLLDNVSATNESLRESEEQADPAHRASLELKTRDRQHKLLRKFESAIAKIDSGTCGYCEYTGEPIGLARLIARPTATLSIEAQERHEQLER